MRTIDILDTVKFMISSYNVFLDYIVKEKVYNGYNLTIPLCTEYYIPNNNNKWYCVATFEKSSHQNPVRGIKGTKGTTRLFFFDNKGDSFYINKEINTSDVYTNQQIPELLLEGYLYDNTGTSKTFSVTDILIKNSVTINKVYPERLCILKNSLKDILPFLQNLDGYLSVIINDQVYSENDIDSIKLSEMVCIRNKNVYIETIQNFIKTNTLHYSVLQVSEDSSVRIPQDSSVPCLPKRILKTRIPDVYNVFNNVSGTKEGILYVKTIPDSRRLLDLFRDSSELVLQCKFNIKFQRWEYVPIDLH